MIVCVLLATTTYKAHNSRSTVQGAPLTPAKTGHAVRGRSSSTAEAIAYSASELAVAILLVGRSLPPN